MSYTVAKPAWWNVFIYAFLNKKLVLVVFIMAEFAEASGFGAEQHDAGNSTNVTKPLCGASDPAMTVPQGPWSTNPEQKKKKKVVLHVDLNNTILVSDAATDLGTVAALDYFLSTVTWGKMNKHGNCLEIVFLYFICKQFKNFAKH